MSISLRQQSMTKSTTLIGEDTDLLVLLLFKSQSVEKALYFRSDTSKDTKVHDINVLRNVLGSDVSKHLLFAHAFTGCDTMSRIYGMGKKPLIQKLIRGDPVLVNCAVQFCKQNQSIEDIAETGQKAIVALVGGKDGQSLHSLRRSVLTRKVISSKAFVKPEKLPPTSGAMKYHSLRTHLQIMTWMGYEEGMDATDWGWRFADAKNILLPVMTEQDPAPQNLMKVVHCQCTTACLTLRCSCKNYGLACSSACGSCQLSQCNNYDDSDAE